MNNLIPNATSKQISFVSVYAISGVLLVFRLESLLDRFQKPNCQIGNREDWWGLQVNLDIPRTGIRKIIFKPIKTKSECFLWKYFFGKKLRRKFMISFADIPSLEWIFSFNFWNMASEARTELFCFWIFFQ